jgi:hypothetical protein
MYHLSCRSLVACADGNADATTGFCNAGHHCCGGIGATLYGTDVAIFTVVLCCYTRSTRFEAVSGCGSGNDEGKEENHGVCTMH